MHPQLFIHEQFLASGELYLQLHYWMEQAVCRQYIVYGHFFFYLVNYQIAVITMFNDSSPHVRIVNPAHLFCVTVLDGRNGLTQLCLKWNIDRLLILWRRAVTTCIIDAKINCCLKKT